MKTPSTKNKRTKDNKGETNGGDDSYMAESNVVDDLPLAKSNDDQHFVKGNKSEDGEQGKKKNKKKQSEHKEYTEFKSNECEDDNKGKKMKKKQKLIEGNTLKECNDFRSNGGEEGEHGEQDKKMKKKKKKLSEESKHKEYSEFKSNECEDDQGKKMKKKQNLIEGNTLNECNDFRSHVGEVGEQDKKMKKKKKKLSEESKHKEYSEFKSNECEDDQGKKMKKKQNLIEGNTLNECNDFRSHGGEVGEQDKKMKKKKKKLSEESKHKEYSELKSNEREDDGHGKKMKKKQKLIEGNTLNECNDFRSNGGEDGEQDKKMKKKQLREESKHKEYSEFKSNECEDDGRGKKMKKKLIEEGKNKEYNDIISNEGGDGDQCKTMNKNKPSNKRKSKENNDQVKKKKKKEAKAVTSEPPDYAHNESPNLEPNGPRTPKRVSFSGEEESFCCDGLVRGKRFTPEEDEKIIEAVYDFIDSRGLGDDGLAKVLKCISHPEETRGCWKTIAKALPHRPPFSVYMRAHLILERNGKCKWTPDELEFIQKTYKQHGPNFGIIAEALGKSRQQVKQAWRRLSFENSKRGHGSQEEYQTLFNLVNLDLRKRASEPYRKSRHGMLRDNISWEAIGHKLGTRDSAWCCTKWYDQLTSPMVASGDWCDTDDFRLINALYTLDACCMEEVEWDELLEHRSGDVCRKRWDQMVRHIGEHARKSFIEQVEILTKRFCPDLLEAREAFDNKPVIC